MCGVMGGRNAGVDPAYSPLFLLFFSIVKRATYNCAPRFFWPPNFHILVIIFVFLFAIKNDLRENTVESK